MKITKEDKQLLERYREEYNNLTRVIQKQLIIIANTTNENMRLGRDIVELKSMNEQLKQECVNLRTQLSDKVLDIDSKVENLAKAQEELSSLCSDMIKTIQTTEKVKQLNEMTPEKLVAQFSGEQEEFNPNGQY